MSKRPFLHVFQSVIQQVPNGVDFPLSMDRVVLDNIGDFDPRPGQNTRYYPSIPGWYDCYGSACFSNDSLAGDRASQFYINGTQTDNTPYGGQHPPAQSGFIASFAICTALIFCNGTTDYISFTAAQSSGGPLNTWYLNANSHSYMTIRWVAP